MSAAVAFGPTANPDAYVPWSGSERALAALSRWVRGAKPSFCVLAAPPGMGKTLLLRVLAVQTAGSLRSLHLPYPDVPRAGLYAFLLQGLGKESPDLSADAVAAALRAEPQPILLLIDEGELLPLDTVHGLRELAAAAEGRLRVAIAVTRDERADELAAAFGEDAESVRIEGAMSAAEVTRHVREQLARGEIDARVAARFDSATVAELHRRSEGIPASLQSHAARLLFEAQRANGEFRTRDPAPAPAATEMRSAPTPRTGGRGPIFALGALVGIAAGVATVGLAPRLFDAERAGEAAVLVEPPPALPPVSAATPPAPPPAPEPDAPRAEVAPAAPTLVSAPAAEPPVTVSFNAAPWAYVEIDGRLIGVTPIAAHPVAPGRHRVTASLPDGRVVEREVEIGPDRNRRIVFP
jgi:hypothetical protein